MENLHRNEMEIDLDSVKILLRPTFENLSAMESKLGGLAALTFKYGSQMSGQKTDDFAQMAKAFPTHTETVQIIYYNQLEKKYSIDEICELVLSTGVKACSQALLFLVRCTSGAKPSQLSPSAKKKSSK